MRQKSTLTDAFGVQTVSVSGNGKQKSTSPDGTLSDATQGIDPRFGLQAPSLKSMTVTTPAGLISTVSETSAVTLSDPNNLLSVVNFTDVISINGRNYSSAFDRALRKLTSTSPAGRQSFSYLDATDHLTQSQVAGLSASNFTYDQFGRLETITSGSGVDARLYTISYNTSGYISGMTDPLLRNVTFEYDSAGRLSRQVLPDLREINYLYDANGNLISITPPGRPSHGFSHTLVDLLQGYTPPNLGVGNITYDYNLDRQITDVHRSDNTVIHF